MSNILHNTAEADNAAHISSIRPHFTVQNSETGATVQVDLPGVPADQLKVTSEKQQIKVIARRSDSIPEEWALLNNTHRPPAYSLKLNVHADLDPSTVKARFVSGVLMLHIAKRSEILPKKIDINTTE